MTDATITVRSREKEIGHEDNVLALRELPEADEVAEVHEGVKVTDSP